MRRQQKWVKKYYAGDYLGMGLLLVVVILVVSFLIIRPESTSNFCNQNPDKCVCEKYKFESYNREKDKFEDEFIDYCEDLNEVGTTSAQFASTDCNSHCTKFRKKTQTELDIDDCNNNPREDEICKCEENNYQYYLTSPNNNISCTVNQNKLIITSENNATFNIRFPECLTNGWCSCKEIGDPVCIKSRPLTECEKGNFNWVEETTYEYDISCNSPKTPCYRFKSRNPDMQQVLLYDSVYAKNVDLRYVTLILNKTVCREKTEQEKYCGKEYGHSCA